MTIARSWPLFGLISLLVLTGELNAQTGTYTYTGNHFAHAVAPYTTTEFIRGYFTTSTPLPANLSSADIRSQVQSFSFSVGETTWDSTNAYIDMQVSTVAQGQITGWEVYLEGQSGPPNGLIMFTCYGVSYGCSTGPNDMISLKTPIGTELASIFGGPGAWSSSGAGNNPGGVITTVVGSGSTGYYNGSFSGDGALATAATLNQPMGVAVDASGNLFIADTLNFRVRKLSNGIITTIAGGGTPADGLGDGAPATSASMLPAAVALDASGNLFIADVGSNRIRKISSDGVITTVAGSGTAGFSLSSSNGGFAGDGGPAASALLNSPRGIALDQSGNLFIADSNNHRIRKVSATGVITTIAGSGGVGLNSQGSSNGGFAGDGGLATSALLNTPTGVAVDASGNIFIADEGNDRIRKVSAIGLINTYVAVFTGDDGEPTQLFSPSGVALDTAGNLYIAESSGDRIRRVTVSGIATVAGSGNGGSSSRGALSGDGGPATSALLSSPEGVAVDAAGNVFIADTTNNRIREVFAPSSSNSTGGQSLPNVATVGNGASFSQLYAPGMLMSVFGTNLSTGSSQTITTAPLPFTSFSGTSVTINGVLAPLLYISATQINLQIPYEVSPGTATLTVNAGGQSASTTFGIQSAGPGIFVDSQNGHMVPTESATPGSTIECFLTGVGQVTPSEATGNVPGAGEVPVPILPLTMTIGGVAVTPVYVGIPNWSVGVLQINFVVPSTLVAGTYPIVITVGGISSQAALLTITDAQTHESATYAVYALRHVTERVGEKLVVEITRPR